MEKWWAQIKEKSAPLAVSYLDEKEMMLCRFRDDALVAKLCPSLVIP